MHNDLIQIITKAKNTPWLIMPEALETIVSIIDRRMTGERLSSEEINALLSSNEYTHPEKRDSMNGVGVLNIQGPIYPKANLMTEFSGATSLDSFRQQFRTMMDDSRVGSIVLNIDSPGGVSDLVMETGNEIRAARESKPIYSVANTTAGSAALWLASQASRFYSTPSGMVGSLGAYMLHEDLSGALAKDGVRVTFVSAGKYKTEGNQAEPLSAEATEYRQNVIDKLYDQFIYAVAKGRNVDTDAVKANFGQGRMLLPEDALSVGMIDGVVELDEVIGSLLSNDALPALSSSPALPVGVTSRGGRIYLTSNRTHTEHADVEHSEPGQGEVIPRQDYDRDRAAETGSRRDTPPIAHDPTEYDQETGERLNGGNGMNPLLRSYAEALGIAVSDDMEDANLRTAIAEKLGVSAEPSVTDEQFFAALATHTTTLIEEVGPLREANAEIIKRQKFAEMFPDEAARMARLEKRDDETTRREFGDRVSVVRAADGSATKLKLSAVARELAETSFVKLRTHQLTGDELATLINTVASESGTVEMGERGSSRTTEPVDVNGGTVLETRNAFADLVKNVMEEDKLEYGAAVKEAARRDPALFEAYQGAHNRK